MLKINLKSIFVLFIAWGTVVHSCLPNGVRGCDCVAQPNCGPCAQASSQPYSSYSYDNSYQQQQQQPSAYQSSYQAPPLSQYQPVPPPPPPPPSLPAPEYQPPNIYLPGPSGPQLSLPSSQEAPPAQYPSREYQQMLSPDQTENDSAHQPPRETQTSAPQYSATPKVESYSESYHNSIIKVGSASGGNERSDQTAYRESYKHENGESVARYESGSIHAPPPEDPPVENESKDGDDYNQDIQQQMTLTIQKLPTTQAYSSPTPPPSPPSTTTSSTATAAPTVTVPPTANVYKQAPQEYAAVLREPLEDRKRDQFYTYNDQVCTGIVLAQSKEISVLEVAKKCMEIQCAAANIHVEEENDDETFEVVYLKIADSRKDNKGFYCISVQNIPTFGNDFDKIESEIKLRKKEGKSSTTTSRFERHRESNHEKRRAPSSFNFQATTFKPRIFRFATIEPKSSY